MEEKLTWETPILQSLDTKQTASGDIHPTEISDSAGPAGS